MNGDEIKPRVVEVKGEVFSMEVADVDQILEPVCEVLPELRATGSEGKVKDFPSWWWVLLEKGLGIPSLEKVKGMPPLEQLHSVGELVGRLRAFLKWHREDVSWKTAPPRDREVVEEMRGRLKPWVDRAESELDQFVGRIHTLPLEKVRAFFEGYTAGLNRGGFDENGDLRGGSPNAWLYMLMLMTWRTVDELRAQAGGGMLLFKWVKGKMGEGFRMDFDPFRAICNRVKLKFGPVGRPPKK